MTTVPSSVVDTGHVAPHERFSLWREALAATHEVVLPEDCDPRRFSAGACGRYLGNALLLESRSTPQRLVRSPREIRADQIDHYIIRLQHVGWVEPARPNSTSAVGSRPRTAASTRPTAVNVHWVSSKFRHMVTLICTDRLFWNAVRFPRPSFGLAASTMAHVFISYAREDREQAERLADLLAKRGFEVWWDWNLVGGTSFRDAIHAQLTAAEKAIVLWSEHSVASAFVIDEATLARRSNKLIPVMLEGASPPLGFGDLHGVETDDLGRDIDLIVSALKGEVPQAGRHLRPSRLRLYKLAPWLAIVAFLLLGAAFYSWSTLGPDTDPLGDSALKNFAVIQKLHKQYDEIQSIYAEIKQPAATCETARDLVKRLQVFQKSSSPMPIDPRYSVLYPEKKEKPTIGDVATDRILRIKTIRKECFVN